MATSKLVRSKLTGRLVIICAKTKKKAKKQLTQLNKLLKHNKLDVL